MTLLAIETSCDETSAAVVRDGVVLANVVSSQVRFHAQYGGVVPELAAREHLRNLPKVVAETLREAGVAPTGLNAFAATQGPGLPSALLVGLKYAQSMAFALGRPFLGIHHHEAHLYSPWMAGDPPRSQFKNFVPNVSLVVSGGHTMLVHVPAEFEHYVLGVTVDDAAGECFDKVAKLIGLGYPGGPELDRLAREGRPSAFAFPRPMIHESNDDFSFAGLKTSVRYFVQKNPAILKDAQGVRDLCASVERAIVDVLVTKTLRAALRLGVACVTASGGVTCNYLLRSELEAACRQRRLGFRLAERSLCTDNAAMVAMLAERKLMRGIPATPLDAEIEPRWSLSAQSRAGVRA